VSDVVVPVRPRRTVRVVVAVVGLILVLGAVAAYAAYRFLDGGGPRPEDVLPASTVAEISVDLDPHAGQKIAAIEALRKFPALRKSLGLSSEDDLRKELVDNGLTRLCPHVDYARDVRPWIGDRAAVAAVDLGGTDPVPALALQITDPGTARQDFARIAACVRGSGGTTGIGYAVGTDYLIVSDSQAHAETILAGGRKASLAADPTYQKWTSARGSAGVVNFYIAPAAGKVLGNVVTQGLRDLPGVAGRLSSQLGTVDGGDPAAAMRTQLASFRGAAGALRFADDGLELVVVSQGSTAASPAGVGTVVTDLPADTAFAVAGTVGKDGASAVVKRVRAIGPSGQSFLDNVQAQTGLRLPADLQALLGHAISFSVGGDSPATASGFNDPSQVPVGVVLHGDPARALAVITTLTDHLGTNLSDLSLVTERGPDALVLSPSRKYAESLTASGGLGAAPLFQRAVPDPAHAQFVLYLALDGKWRTTLADLAGDSLSAQDKQDLIANLTPFGALGMSASSSGGVNTFDLRVATR
jgi:hypothetical protein